jgi:hypothetical protein
MRSRTAASGDLRGEGEHVRREQIARIEIDEAGAKLVDHRRAGVNLRDLQQRRGGPHDERRYIAERLGHHEEDGQQIDEPQRAERLDEGEGVSLGDAVPAEIGREAGGLEGELDGDPERVEIGEVEDLAVEIVVPIPVDDPRQEQSRNEKEIGHAEGLGEGDRRPHEARRAGRLLDAQGRMHHHHHDDAEALAVIDPGDAVLVKLHEVPPSSSRRGTIQGSVASLTPEPAGRGPKGH